MKGESLLQVLQVIFDMFCELMKHIDHQRDKWDRLQTQHDDSQSPEEKYSSLEKLLQKYEKQIREHIRVEQQLKIYAENMQEGLVEKEKQAKDNLDSSNKTIEELEKKISKSELKIAEVANENKVLKEMLKSFHSNQNLIHHPRNTFGQRDSQESLRENLHPNRTEIFPTRKGEMYRSNPRNKSREISPLIQSKAGNSKKRTIFMGNVEKVMKSRQGLAKGLLVNFKKLN